MICNNCGANLTDGSNFCNNCGTPIATIQITPIYNPGVELAISGLVCGIIEIIIKIFILISQEEPYINSLITFLI